MPSQVIRARIAPVALLIASAFVIVGFFRADAEIARAQANRAELTLSEVSALTETFILRRLDELEIALEASGIMLRDDSLLGPSTSLHSRQALASDFNSAWLVDSTSHIRSLVPSSGRTAWFPLDSAMLWRVVQNGSSQRERLVALGRQSGTPVLVLIAPVPSLPRTRVVISASIDSLAMVLQRSRSETPFDIAVTTQSDTVLALRNLPPNAKRRRLSQSIVLPGGTRWIVSIAYAPSGRGVRIGLWALGLSAFIALGVGLILERREANRIADRSMELEHLSAELLRANRAKSEFLANVSHELRTPLNAIVGFVDLLRDGVYGPLNSRQAGPVERIEASANHLRHLVDQVLDLAKMAAGRLEVHTEPIELRPFVFDVASEVEPLMTEKGLNFSLAVGASLPRVRTDPTHLRQILVNLLGNAAKFTTSGGISIRGKLVKGKESKIPVNGRLPNADQANADNLETVWIALQVADSGIGIPEKDRERIFDEFEQVNAGPRGDSMRRGTGLGLSISRRLARLLGGDITVESELGRGSVFTLWIPVDPADIEGSRTSGR